jgi:hypothetical protein
LSAQLRVQLDETVFLPFDAAERARRAAPRQVFLGQRQLLQLDVDRLGVLEAVGLRDPRPVELGDVLAQLQPPVDPAVGQLEFWGHLQRGLDVLRLVAADVRPEHGGGDVRQPGVGVRIMGVQTAHGREPSVAFDRSVPRPVFNA